MAVVFLVLMVASITFPRRSTQTSMTTFPSMSLRTVMEGLEITFRYIRPVNGTLPVPVPVPPVPVPLLPSLPVPVPRPLPLPFPSGLPFMSLTMLFSELPETNRGASGAVLVIRGLLTMGAGAGVGLGFAASGSGTWGLGAGANGAGFISGFSGRLANRSGLASNLTGCLISCGVTFGFL